MRVSVRVEADRVAEAGFDARGCAAARAAGSAAVELVERAPILDAARMTPSAIAEDWADSRRARCTRPISQPTPFTARSAAARDGATGLPTVAGRTLVAMSGGVDSAAAAGSPLAPART